jgi:hypothetical protein
MLRCLALPDNKEQMKLTDNEIRDIMRHLEAGKPLDEESFKRFKPKTFSDLLASFTQHKA